MWVIESDWLEAIEKWKAKIREENNGECDEPEGVDLICDEDELLQPLNLTVQSVIRASLAWMKAWGVIWEGSESQAAHDALNDASKALYDAVCDYERIEQV